MLVSPRQFQLLNPVTDLYELSYLVPIRVNGSANAVLELSDRYHLREAYLGKKQIKADGFGRPIGHYHCFWCAFSDFHRHAHSPALTAFEPAAKSRNFG